MVRCLPYDDACTRFLWRINMVLSRTAGTLGSIAQIFGMLVAFAVIVAAAYYVSKYFS